MLAFLLLLSAEVPRLVLDLPPSPENPRNTEGSFLRLKNGDLLYAYSKFTGGTSDHATGHVASRLSKDGGMTWTSEDRTLAANEQGLNAMSVSFLRLKSGEIALFVINKNTMRDSRPVMRISRDEGKTWSKPTPTIPDTGYFVLNNDRVVQLKSGRILLPVALHRNETDDPKKFNGQGIAMAYMSDDKGKSWRRSKTVLENPGSPNGFQEPGIVELKNGRLLMYLRTSQGSQYVSYSSDNGDTWTPPQPSNLKSPLSPASIKRIPKTGDLLAVWNDHSKEPSRRRTPLTLAISRNDGQTWERAQDIEVDPQGWYCYTAIEFVEGRVLLAYVAGGTGGLPHLSRSVIKSVPLDWIYGVPSKNRNKS
jgi:predicted neuraminidase